MANREARPFHWMQGTSVLLVTLLLVTTVSCDGSHASRSALTDDYAVQFGGAAGVLELTIGDSGRAEYEFAEVFDMLIAHDGTVWVADGNHTTTPVTSPRLRQYDSLGRFLRHIGRSGGGPGEYRAPYALAQLRDNRIAVRDNSWPERVHLYSPDGSFDTTWTLAANMRWSVGAGGAIHVDTSGAVWLPIQQGRPGPNQRGYRYMRMRPDGTMIDEVPPPILPRVERERVSVTRQLPGGGVSVAGLTIPFQARAVAALSPFGYFATARTDKYEITFRAVNDTVFAGSAVSDAPSSSVAHTRQPVPLETTERADAQRKLDAEATSLGVSAPEVAKHKPILRHIAYSEDGRLLVFVSAPSQRNENGEWVEPIVMDLYDRQLNFVGAVQLPPSFWPVRVVGNSAWGLYRQPDGAVVVRRYRISPQGDD